MGTVVLGTEVPVAKQITRCRVCGSDALVEVWNGGALCIVEFPRMTESPKKPRVPLCLLVCERCWLVQLSHTTDPKFLYEEFWYKSGINESMQRALRDLARSALEEAGSIRQGEWVLDIGCNDGTLLLNYPDTLQRVGMDPARNLFSFPPDEWTFVCDYFSAERAREVNDGLAHFKIITAVAMFYDLDDPVTFCREVASVLAPEGVFVVQMNYLRSMLEVGGIDNVCHEHLTYFSLASLQEVFHRAGLDIYRAEVNAINGGSIRVYACHRGKRAVQDSVRQILRAEAKFGVTSLDAYDAFAYRVRQTCLRVDEYIRTFADAGKRLYAYGASTRGTTLLQLLTNRLLLRGCAERDERKIGRYMVSGALPIISEPEFREKADVALLLPWHFADAIFQREHAWFARGGQMIVPLPTPYIQGGGR